METKTKLIKVNNKNSDFNPYKDFLEEILNISSKIYDSQKEILAKLDTFETRIIDLEKSIKPYKNDNDIQDLKELKYEQLCIDKKDADKALLYADYRSVIYIFRLIYKNKNNSNYVYPIRITGKRSYEYYDNNKWNPDLYGHHSMNVICKNIQELFMSFNIIENYNIEEFMSNQTFIFKLSDDRYKKDIFKNIVEEVRINNI
jgi:hypothetical protein